MIIDMRWVLMTARAGSRYGPLDGLHAGVECFYSQFGIVAELLGRCRNAPCVFEDRDLRSLTLELYDVVEVGWGGQVAADLIAATHRGDSRHEQWAGDPTLASSIFNGFGIVVVRE